MKTGIVLVGHGSRTEESRGIYEELAERMGDRSDFEVEVGYMKHGTPNIVNAIKGFADRGIKRIVIVPLFILPGLHVTDDIPVLLGLKDGSAPEFGYEKLELPEEVELLYAGHVGADQRLADIALDRAREVLNGRRR